ncbi:MAG: hypothetical protein K0Q59_1125 [Paenibacillus sp.]|jgi:hypothetical protein|nr:hypothetical protein [Paenibacillus sp.]
MSDTRSIAALYSGVSYQHRSWTEPKYNQYLSAVLYAPELTETSFDPYDVVIVPSRVHKGLMDRINPWLQRFVDNGGTVVVFWPQTVDSLASHWENRPTNFWWWLDKDAKSGLQLQKPEYDLFNYLTLEDATWHYHGVFWPPEGAEALITTEDNGAILYVDKVSSSKGTWIVSTLDPEFHYGSYFMPATERFLDGFMPWLAKGAI